MLKSVLLMFLEDNTAILAIQTNGRPSYNVAEVVVPLAPDNYDAKLAIREAFRKSYLAKKQISLKVMRC